MPMIKTSELTGAALDWAVAKCEGFLSPLFKEPRPRVIIYQWSSGSHPSWNPIDFGTYGVDKFEPSADWAQGGPIIEREKLDIFCSGQIWDASTGDRGNNSIQSGSTPLTAAMRCYVASKLGESVDIPEELL